MVKVTYFKMSIHYQFDSLGARRSGQRMPVQSRFSATHPDLLWSPTNLLYNEYYFFHEVKVAGA
jgi:hypothetical protein